MAFSFWLQYGLKSTLTALSLTICASALGAEENDRSLLKLINELQKNVNALNAELISLRSPQPSAGTHEIGPLEDTSSSTTSFKTASDIVYFHSLRYPSLLEDKEWSIGYWLTHLVGKWLTHPIGYLVDPPGWKMVDPPNWVFG